MDISKMIEVLIEFTDGFLDTFGFNFKKKRKKTNNRMVNKERKMEEKTKINISPINNSSKVKFFQPKDESTTIDILDEVKNGKIVIIKMDEVDELIKEKTEQYIYGFCFAFNIQPEYVDNNTIMIDPMHKTVSRYGYRSQ